MDQAPASPRMQAVPDLQLEPLAQESPRYMLVLAGNVLPDRPRAQVCQNLARLLKQELPQVERLLNGRARVIKKQLDLETARKYQQALEQAGAECSCLPMPVERQAVVHQPSLNWSQSAPEPAPEEASRASFQGASDRITEKLGLARIEGFSLGTFFSEVFSKHSPDEVERMLAVGTPDTTPPLDPSMGVMPNPWIFFRVLSGSLLTYIIFLYAWKEFENIHVLPGLILMGSFAVPFSVLILFFELNTPRNISIFRVFQLVVTGGAISLLVSLFLFDVLDFMDIFGASSAGFIEETGKLLALLFALRKIKWERYPYQLNALLLGAAVGTGFAAFESAGYALRIGLMNQAAMLANIQVRGAMSPFAHIVWTAIAASAFWAARPWYTSHTDTLLSQRFLRLFMVPVGLHFVWNMDFTGPFMLKYVILGFVAWVVVISLTQSGLKEIEALVDKTEPATP